MTGFCLGGRISYQAAKWADDLDVDAVVAFYGSFASELGELRCPALLLFAERDEHISAEDIATMTAHHADDVVLYPDNGHAFMRDGSDSFEPVAAADGWARLLDFFHEHLTPTAPRASPGERQHGRAAQEAPG